MKASEPRHSPLTVPPAAEKPAPDPVSKGLASKRLLEERERLERCHHLEGCTAAPREEDLFHWSAVIEGPVNTPYESGTFFVDLIFDENYPFVAPQIHFLTRIYHCNIDSERVRGSDGCYLGNVRVDKLFPGGWNPCMMVLDIFASIMSLLRTCNPDISRNLAMAHQYLTHREEYERTAREWTEKYAQ